MTHSRRARCTLTAVLALAVSIGGTVYAQKTDGKPSLSLKATPVAGFAPLRVRVTVDMKGGADDYAELYCPSVQWVWGDDITSENSEDCSPYESGKSAIKRRYSGEHVYRDPGTYKLTLRLKQKDRIVAAGTASVEVRPGLRDSNFD